MKSAACASRRFGAFTVALLLSCPSWAPNAHAEVYERRPIIRTFPGGCRPDSATFVAQSASVVIGFECIDGSCPITSVDDVALLVDNTSQTIYQQGFDTGPADWDVNHCFTWQSSGGDGSLDIGGGGYPGVSRTERLFTGLSPGTRYRLRFTDCMVGEGTFVLTLGFPAPTDPGWTEFTTCVLQNILATSACAWVDMDADGRDDFARLKAYEYGSNSGSLSIYRALSGGGFDQLGPDYSVTPCCEWVQNYPASPTQSWADMDADGDLDGLFGGNSIRLLVNGGNASFTVLEPAALAGVQGEAVWVDYNRDGVLDVSITSNGLRLFRGLGGGQFAAADWLAMGANTLGQTWGDFTDDGWPDVYVSSPQGPDRCFRNQTGQLVDAGLPAGLYGYDYGSEFAGWCDIDGDGDLDLFSSSGGLQGNRLLLNTGGTLAPGGNEALRCLQTGGSVVWGDVDNDGWPDLLLASMSEGGAHRLYRNVSGAGFASITPAALPGSGSARSAGLVDLDGDGDLDVGLGVIGIPYGSNFQFTDGSHDYDRFFLNQISNQGHWMRIELQGVASNRSALGARVTAWTGGRRLVREVEAGDGFSQPPLACHFGLGSATRADSVVVRWPTGIQQTFANLPSNRRIVLREGTAEAVVAAPRPAEASNLELVSFPNPFRSSLSLRFSLPRDGRASLEVIDVLGRRVRSLLDAQLAAGNHTVTWDGGGSDGRRVPVGVYFVTLRAGEAIRRVPVVRGN